MTRHMPRIAIIIAVASMLAAGCSSGSKRPKRATFKNQEDGLVAQLAVLSVASWEQYRDSFQPTFKLGPDEALAASLPTTRAAESRFLSAAVARVKAALPTTTFTSTATRTRTTDSKPTTTEEQSIESASGDASAIEIDASPAGDRTAAGLPGAGTLATPLGAPTSLHYRAANALYQEVQAINMQVKRAAIDSGLVPYVVRLQVSVMPRQRNAPYDVYSQLAFFAGPWRDPTPAGADVEGCPSDRTQRKVKIIPLLATDALEGSLESHTANELRQLALALSAMLYGVGIDSDLQRIDESLRTVIARDLNATFTIARSADNAIVVRIGAHAQAATDFALVAADPQRDGPRARSPWLRHRNRGPCRPENRARADAHNHGRR